MFDTQAQRAAALGFGHPVWAVLPVAEGAITIEAAGQALAGYFFDLSDHVYTFPSGLYPTSLTED